MASDTISVVIPWGKAAGNINGCLESVLSQHHVPSEVIVVCNGPIAVEDGRRLIRDDLLPRVQLVDGADCANGNEARNLGVRQAVSKWIAFMDSDDAWYPDHLSASLSALQTDGADFCYGSVTIHEDGEQYVRRASHFSTMGTPENYLLSYRPATTPTYVCLHSLALDVPWDTSLRRHQDYDWFSRICRVATVTVVDKPTVMIDWTQPVRHRFHGDCLRVVRGWHDRVEKRYMIRHLLRHAKQSMLSGDKAFFRLFGYLLYITFFSRGIQRPDTSGRGEGRS